MSDFFDVLIIIFLSIFPISELRGAIPLGISLGLSPLFVFLISIFFNSIIFFPIYFGLDLLYERFFCRFDFVRKILKRIEKKRKKIDKYGYLGLVFFVAIPAPFTGAYTASVLAWLLRLNWKKSFLAISFGVVIAGIVVSLFTLGIINLF